MGLTNAAPAFGNNSGWHPLQRDGPIFMKSNYGGRFRSGRGSSIRVEIGSHLSNIQPQRCNALRSDDCFSLLRKEHITSNGRHAPIS